MEEELLGKNKLLISSDNKFVIIGSGNMAFEYSKVLDYLDINFVVLSRSDKAAGFFNEFKNGTFIVSKIIDVSLENIETIILNTVSIESLESTTIDVIKFLNPKTIILEKPGSLSIKGLSYLENLSKNNNSNILIAFNRRFYSSVIKLKQEIKNSKISSVFFDFTEFKINSTNYPNNVLNRWAYANSIHIFDLVFHMIGFPKSINSYVGGENDLQWHKDSSIFSGYGISTKDVMFSYNSNWLCPGRWRIEFLSTDKKYIFSPIEEIKAQNNSGFSIENIALDEDDKKFKPGLLKMINSIIANDFCEFQSLPNQIELFKAINKILNYDDGEVSESSISVV